MNPKTDWFFDKQTKWKEAYSELRILVLDCGLTEELKWSCPCYTVGKSNIVLIHGFKDYCALLFMQGALLKDTKNILVQYKSLLQLQVDPTRFVSRTCLPIGKYVIKLLYIYSAAVARLDGSACPNCLKPQTVSGNSKRSYQVI